MGNKTIIKAGDVQRMSAGTGLTHSEFNLAQTPVHFYQIWIYPDEKGLAPTYDQKSFSPDTWTNRLLPVASGQGIDGTVSFHTAATIYRASLETGQTLTHTPEQGRRLFVYLTDGQMTVNDHLLDSKDQARLDITGPVVFSSRADAEFILIDVPSCQGWGYDSSTLKGKTL